MVFIFVLSILLLITTLSWIKVKQIFIYISWDKKYNHETYYFYIILGFIIWKSYDLL